MMSTATRPGEPPESRADLSLDAAENRCSPAGSGSPARPAVLLVTRLPHLCGRTTEPAGAAHLSHC
jgi:hypothetical protein